MPRGTLIKIAEHLNSLEAKFPINFYETGGLSTSEDSVVFVKLDYIILGT